MMRTLILSAAAAAFLMSGAPGAEAAGCIKGALLGGVAGHVAGHGLLGAAGGCIVGRHMANKKAAQQQNQGSYQNNGYQNSNGNQNNPGYQTGNGQGYQNNNGYQTGNGQ